MTRSILVLHGPGTGTEAPASAAKCCEDLGFELKFHHSEDVDELCALIGQDTGSLAGLVICPYAADSGSAAAMARYNDAIEAIANDQLPIIELHMQNIMATESLDTTPLNGPAGRMGMVCGLGETGYELAIGSIARKSRQVA